MTYVQQPDRYCCVQADSSLSICIFQMTRNSNNLAPNNPVTDTTEYNISVKQRAIFYNLAPNILPPMLLYPSDNADSTNPAPEYMALDNLDGEKSQLQEVKIC